MAMVDPTSPAWPPCTAASARSIRCARSATPSKSSASCRGLASGQRLSAFALTEPSAGSDLTALRTRGRARDGDDYVVNGEKLFITNVVPGRTIGLVCLIDKQPAVLIVDLPTQENEHFQLQAIRAVCPQARLQPGHHVPRLPRAGGQPAASRRAATG